MIYFLKITIYNSSCKMYTAAAVMTPAGRFDRTGPWRPSVVNRGEPESLKRNKTTTN